MINNFTNINKLNILSQLTYGIGFPGSDLGQNVIRLNWLMGSSCHNSMLLLKISSERPIFEIPFSFSIIYSKNLIIIVFLRLLQRNSIDVINARLFFNNYVNCCITMYWLQMSCDIFL